MSTAASKPSPADDPAPSGPDTPARRRTRRWPWLVGLLVGLPLVYFVVAPAIQTAYLRDALPKAALAARDAAAPDADLAHATGLAGFQERLGLRGAPVFSASYETCYTDHSDSGWFAVNYNYRCQLLYVDLLEASGPNAAVAEALRRQTERAHVSVSTRDYLRAAGRPAEGELRPRSFEALRPGAHADARAALAAGLADPAAVTYAAADARRNLKLRGETGSPQLDPATQYYAYTHVVRYLDRDIGCAIGRPPFCSSPLGD